MVGIASYKSMEMIDAESPFGLATFHNAGNEILHQVSEEKWYDPHEQSVDSENRSRTERVRCKIVSKIKQFLIEVQGRTPVNIIASYKKRDPGKLVPAAFVGRNLGLEWLDASSVVDGVRKAMGAFIQDLNWGQTSQQR